MQRILKTVAFGLLFVLLGIAVTIRAQASPESAQGPETPQLYILSNSSPHISVIDTATNDIVETMDMPDFTGWGWNDDNNYFDGENLWLGLRDPETDDAEVIALNLETLEVTARLPLGKENLTLYIGKSAEDDILHVSKMGAGAVAVIDTVNFEVLDIWEDVPVNGDVVCDADVATGPDGTKRFFYPTRNGDTVVSLDAQSGEVITVIDSPEGATPLMLTTAPDDTVWVQEVASNSNAVYDSDLNLVDRFLTGKAPIVASFSPDGQYGFIGHNDDTVITVIDVETLEEIEQIEVGIHPQKLAIHPNGEYVYAILTEEASVAVIETETWTVTQRISLGTNPGGIYLWARTGDDA